ncbi:MAG: S41 family peptidase, partial [Candidatus Marsarchaeota archaeon]|nr:S41 family peptidase [Candidatus Marsarchaeota archaeon]
YGDWVRSFDQRTEELLSRDLNEFEAGIRELLSRLGSSHTLFYKDKTRQVLPQHSINATVRKFSLNGAERWMFLDVFEDGPAHSAGIKPGDLLLSLDGDDCRPPTMPPFGIGQAHRLRISSIHGEHVRDLSIAVPQVKTAGSIPPMIEPKSLVHRVIAPGVGLLKVTYFPGGMGMRFAKQLDAAMTSLKDQGVDRLIIDLRGNIGGGLGLARLASYLCPGRLPIGHSLTRARLHAGYDLEKLPHVPMPQNMAGLLWTLGRFSFRDKSVMLLTQGLGPQPFHNRIVLLVNEWTNSAAEMVAGFVQAHRLATILGNKTAGNVLGAANFKVGGGYTLRLPVFGWYTPHGDCLEGKGVSPDIVVDVDPYVLNAGVDQQLDKALKTVAAQSLPGRS